MEVGKVPNFEGLKLRRYFYKRCNDIVENSLHFETRECKRLAVTFGCENENFVNIFSFFNISGRKTVHGVFRQPVTWSQKLDNIHACFQFLNSEGVRTTGISAEG